MQTLRDQIDICREEAFVAHIRAATAPTPRERAEYEHLEKHWNRLVASLEAAVRISDMLQWSSQRLQSPP